MAPVVVGYFLGVEALGGLLAGATVTGVLMALFMANAGGAWSPIGDVTTIMLWIGGQVTTVNIILKVVLPSLVTMIIPLILLSFTQKA